MTVPPDPDLERAAKVVPLDAPVVAFEVLGQYATDPYVALLESRGPTSPQGRYDYLCIDPFLVFRSKREACFVGPPGDLEKKDGDPFAELGALLRKLGGPPSAWTPDLPPFVGGAVGYLGYEMLYLVEKVPDEGRDDHELPDSYFVFYHTVIATDRLENRSWLITTGFAPTFEEASAIVDAKSAAAVAMLEAMPPPSSDRAAGDYRARRDALVGSRRMSETTLRAAGIRPVVTHEEYTDIVRKAKEHIVAGDVFEVCTSQRFDALLEDEALELYRVLRVVNEAPFASFLRFPELEVMSSSPERFLSLDRERWAETRPIKGTRPRGATPEADAEQYRDLATCEKDHSENIMIVDVARNDLGRVCEFGTVSVPELRVIESFAFTHQLVSTVRGRVRRNVEPLALVRAAFPGASMTGAPKVEAMKIIDQLEPVKRGVFSGAIGYFDFDGALGLSIVIRTFIKSGNDRLQFHVGGAIVADSDPEDEYQETLDKAHGLVTALRMVTTRALP